MRRNSGKLTNPQALLATLATLFSSGCGGTILKKPMLKVDRSRPKLWLKSGSQTRVTAKIRNIANKLKHADQWITLRRIHRWIKANFRRYRGIKAHVLSRRDATELVEDRTLSGCNDWGLVFITLARATGFPAIYVKSIHKGWARRWVEGDDRGPRMGHVFIELFVQGKWILVDSTRGFYYKNYNPNNPTLPSNYYAYAKAKDPWDMGQRNVYELRRSIENIAEYLERVKFRKVNYPRGYLIPTLVLVAPRPVARTLKQSYPEVRFRRRGIHWIRRNPEKAAGLDVLILAEKPGLRRILHLVADPLGMDGKQVSGLITARAFPRLIQAGKRPICVVQADNADTLMSLSRKLIAVSPTRENALLTDRCKPQAPAKPVTAHRRPRIRLRTRPTLAERFRQTAPERLRRIPARGSLQ